jgi:hypothetical protein
VRRRRNCHTKSVHRCDSTEYKKQGQIPQRSTPASSTHTHTCNPCGCRQTQRCRCTYDRVHARASVSDCGDRSVTMAAACLLKYAGEVQSSDPAPADTVSARLSPSFGCCVMSPTRCSMCASCNTRRYEMATAMTTTTTTTRTRTAITTQPPTPTPTPTPTPKSAPTMGTTNATYIRHHIACKRHRVHRAAVAEPVLVQTVAVLLQTHCDDRHGRRSATHANTTMRQ